MQLTAAFLAALVFSSAATAICAPSRPRGAAKSSVRRCVKLTETRGEGDRSLSFTLHNTCTRRLDCTMSWDVTCGGEATEQSLSSAIETKSSSAFLASAAGCRSENWRISPARWKCSAD
jgi:hypothetical protein